MFVFGPVAILGQDGTAAGVTQGVRPFGQPVPDADPSVKDEAVSAPEAVPLGHLFQVFQDTAPEVKDLVNALAQQVVGRFLAPDAARAEHRDPLVVEPVAVRLPPGGEIAEAGGAGIDRPLERADGDLVIVAGVDHGHVRRRDQGVPVGGIDIVADAGAGVDVGLAHRHDLALQPDLEAGKGRLPGRALLPLQIGAAGQGADVGQHRVDARARACDGAVDPLGRDQQGAGDAARLAHGAEAGAQGVRVREPGEVIERGDDLHGRGCKARRGGAQYGGGAKGAALTRIAEGGSPGAPGVKVGLGNLRAGSTITGLPSPSGRASRIDPAAPPCHPCLHQLARKDRP